MKRITTIFLLFIFLSSLNANAQTLQEKIGQMIMVGFELNDQAKDTLMYDISHRNLGGILLFAYNLQNPNDFKEPTDSQLRNLIKEQSRNLQAQAQTPLFLATDQEGGLVARLDENNGYQETYTNYQLGTEFNSEDSTRKQAALMAGWMAQAGLNLNLAPVVDVNVNPDSPPIGGLDRSFSSNEYTVFKHASWFIDEFHKQDIATSLKHFPGHGSSTSDSHLGITDITNTWQDRELDPFRFLIQAGYNDAIMTGHLFNSNWDDTYPASLSEYAIKTILRDSLGFNGVVITDELFMKAISEHYGFDEAIVQVIKSDSDILLFSKNIYQDKSLPAHVISLITQKINDGVIDEATIDASYNRIIALKNSRMITKTEYVAQNALPRGIDIANYPNPFNPTTNITVTLDQTSEVKIRVANAIGQIVQTISQSRLSAGVHTFQFDGRNLASGLYFVILNTPQARQVHKIMLIK